ncbi:hypothetical protein CFP65_4551 [Kitasatospora sp. MMS16-BH015]|uniref:hypothetical protein n=1 Tax=Kitasatospora sp. MMS16-BH015 TaxID=2018025 RepID=UPI000CA16F21|nr:hypothetical protein [Kitasatospora sp. MMS16-BH015]AUG79295.1 hypothetical protein CFP65_4551 [Kitasatospora sp. MMS16-BH015]
MTFKQRLALAVGAVGVSAVALASPASATGVAWFHGDDEASVDLTPGNGAASWAWIWDGSADQYGTVLIIHLANRSTQRLVTWGQGSSNSSSYGARIVSAQICDWNGSPLNCGSVHYF